MIPSRVPTISKTCLMHTLSWVHVVGNTDHVLGDNLYYVIQDMVDVPKTCRCTQDINTLYPRYQYPVPTIC